MPKCESDNFLCLNWGRWYFYPKSVSEKCNIVRREAWTPRFVHGADTIMPAMQLAKQYKILKFLVFIS